MWVWSDGAPGTGPSRPACRPPGGALHRRRGRVCHQPVQGVRHRGGSLQPGVRAACFQLSVPAPAAPACLAGTCAVVCNAGMQVCGLPGRLPCARVRFRPAGVAGCPCSQPSATGVRHSRWRHPHGGVVLPAVASSARSWHQSQLGTSPPVAPWPAARSSCGSWRWRQPPTPFSSQVRRPCLRQ